MKNIITAILIFFHMIAAGQSTKPEMVQNGDFSEVCGSSSDVLEMPCHWNRRNHSLGCNNTNDHEVLHIGRGALEAYYYTDINGTNCATTTVNSCYGKSPDAPDETDCRFVNLSAIDGSTGLINDPNFDPSTCATDFTMSGPGSNNDKFMLLPPGYGIATRDGMETHLGQKLCKGFYTLTFDVSIPYPNGNSAFGLEVYLNPTQNDKKCEIFNLRHAWESGSIVPGEWRTISRVIEVEEDDDKEFEWLSFVNDRCNLCLDPTGVHAIYIDNVSFKSNCVMDEGPCSPFLGLPEPLFIKDQTSGTICVDNLHNAKFIRLRIFANGTEIKRTEINNPANKICWDQMNDALAAVASQDLVAKVLIQTACCEDEFTILFFRPNNQIVPTDGLDYSPQNKLNNSNCCNPDIVIKDQVIDVVRQYIGSDKITMGPNVTLTSNSNVLLQATNDIDIVEPIVVENGAIFEARIEPCNPPDFQSMPIKTLSVKPVQQELDSTTILSNWQVYPNPASDHLLVRDDDIKSVNSNRMVKLYDFNGKLIYISNLSPGITNKSIDLSHISSGTYFVELESDGSAHERKKIVIQR